MAREQLAPGKTGSIVITAYAEDGTVLDRGAHITRVVPGAVQYRARAHAGIAEGDTRRVQGPKAPTVTKAKANLHARITKLRQEAEEQAEAKRHAGIPVDWTGFAKRHRQWVMSDDAEYSEGSRRIYSGTIDGYFLQVAPTKKGEKPKPHRFDGRKLADITHGELHDWLQDIANRNGDGVAHTCRSILGKMYRRALGYGLIAADPTARLGKVKRSRRTVERMREEAKRQAEAEGKALAVPKDHQRALVPAELMRLQAFLETDARAQRNLIHLMALTMFGAGLRVGEALALRGEDLDTTGDQAMLTVRATVSREPGVGLFLQPWTKTEQGMRKVPIAQSLALRLAEHWQTDRKRAELEPTWNTHGLFFPSERGTIRDTSNTHDKFRHVFDSEAVNLPWATPHVFRRTYATALLAQGLSPVAVASLLGHTDPSFTLKVYGDWTTTPEVATNVLEGLFAVKPESKVVTKVVTTPDQLPA